jgi:predicted transcriptional regulator
MYCHVDIVNKDKVVCLSIEDLTGGKEPIVSIGTKLSRMKIWATLTGKKLGSILKSEMSDPNR